MEQKWSGVGRKLGERSIERTFHKTLEWEWSVEWEAVVREQERAAGVTKIGLSAERQIGRSRCAHMLCLL